VSLSRADGSCAETLPFLLLWADFEVERLPRIFTDRHPKSDQKVLNFDHTEHARIDSDMKSASDGPVQITIHFLMDASFTRRNIILRFYNPLNMTLYKMCVLTPLVELLDG
jgi:hypothetical protein